MKLGRGRLAGALLGLAVSACSPLKIFNAVVPKDGGVRLVVANTAFRPDPRQRLDVYAQCLRSGAHDEMRRILAVMEDDPVGQRQLADRLSAIARHVRETLQTLPVDAGEARDLVLSLIEAIGEDALRSASPAYYRDTDFAGAVSLMRTALQTMQCGL